MPWLKGGPEPELPFQSAITSENAAREIEETAETWRGKVYRFVQERSRSVLWQGATDEEIQFGVPIPANTERPRRRELEERKLVYDSGETRRTRSGRSAIIWRAR